MKVQLFVKKLTHIDAGVLDVLQGKMSEFLPKQMEL